MTFLEQCEQLGVKRSTAQAYRKAHPELTEEQILEYYRNKESSISFTEKCRRAGVNYNAANNFKLRNPNLTDEQIIEMISNQEPNDEPSLRSLCIKLGADYGNYNTYRYNHRDLTPLQALMYYSGKCYINWLGELVEVENYLIIHQDLMETLFVEDYRTMK